MKNIALLFEKNLTINSSGRKPYVFSKDKYYKFTYFDAQINGNTIKKILTDLQYLKNPSEVPIEFCFANSSAMFADKLTFIIFECICFKLLNGVSPRISANFNKSIYTSGIEISPLRYLMYLRPKTREFQKKFKLDVFQTHYRKVINPEKDSNYLSKEITDIQNFLKHCQIDEQSTADITHVVTELIGNACEHGNSDCLVDIDISDDYRKKGEEGLYYGISIAILNFSNILFGDSLKNRFLSESSISTPGLRYPDIRIAQGYHKSKFTESYDIDDFFNIVAFQDKVSSRSMSYAGGTGLTLLIKSLQSRSDTDNCYMLSGKNIVFFREQFLDYSAENWLGFNESQNFLSDIPDKSVIDRCSILFPGTSFNLNFVMKRKDKNDI